MVKIYYLHLGDNIPIYIGKTKNDIKKRLREHKRKIKELNLMIEVIDNVNQNNWKFWESYWIDMFNSWGFNLINKNKGGGGPQKQNSKVKVLLSQKNKRLTSASKSVLQFDLNGNLINEYPSAKSTEVIFSQPQGITKACNGLNNSAHGYLWCYKKDYTKELIESKINKYNKFRTKVLQYSLKGEFIREFSSQRNAAKFLNKQASAINECCKGKRVSAYGFKWEYGQSFG